jgi:Flp pilus assembly protein TadG
MQSSCFHRRRGIPGCGSSRRGNAMVEFAIGFSLLIAAFTGVYRFGYTFFVYNILESAVREGARYGSLEVYDGATNGATFTSWVKNMVVYTNPTPPTGATPVVPGLTTDNVTVNANLDAKGIPTRITVQISNFQSSLFVTTLNKPKCSFDYMGRYTD